MVCRDGRPFWLSTLAVALVVALVSPAFGQGNAVKGVVKDDKGQPVDGATVTITMTDTGRKFQTRSNRRGEFIQIGLASGGYTIVAEKDKLTSATQKATVRAAGPADIELVIGVAAAAASGDAAAARAALVKTFDEGSASRQRGKHDEAIAKFNEAIALNPSCFSCFNAIGAAYTQKKDYDQAEAALNKSIAIKADDPEAYSMLANLYNAQRKFDEAAKASEKATEFSTSLSAKGGAGAGADALFNQGVILWNGGKVAEAKKAFEGAIQANPDHAEAHFQLGMALVNEGNLASAATEFETYLKLAPSGPNAATAKSLVGQLKK